MGLHAEVRARLARPTAGADRTSALITAVIPGRASSMACAALFQRTSGCERTTGMKWSIKEINPPLQYVRSFHTWSWCRA